MRTFLLLGLFASACTAVDPVGNDSSASGPTSAGTLRVARTINDGDVTRTPPASEPSQGLLPPSATPLGTAFPGPGNRISYQGGDVIAHPKAYLIFYGNWAARPTQVALVENYLRGLGTTNYWAINATYTDTHGSAVGPILFGGDYLDPNTDQNPAPAAVVTGALAAGHLPYDPNGIYMVMTSPEITFDGLGTEYCGWHTHGIWERVHTGFPIRYGVVGQTTSGCAWPFLTPNGAAVDGMISTLTHELEETATDPNEDAYVDLSGNENADECAWDSHDETRFQFTAPNGGKANITVGTGNFFIQPNWVNASGGYCGMAADRKRIAIQIPASPGGSVSGSGITCNGVECDFLYLTNSVLTYTVTPPSGFHLQSWANCDSLSGNNCTLTLNADRGILPSFARNPTCHLDQTCNNACAANCDDLPIKQRGACLTGCRNQCTVCN